MVNLLIGLLSIFILSCGRRDRTPDLLALGQMLYQLSYPATLAAFLKYGLPAKYSAACFLLLWKQYSEPVCTKAESRLIPVVPLGLEPRAS